MCEYCNNNKTLLERGGMDEILLPSTQISIENNHLVMIDKFGIKAIKINFCLICGSKQGG